MMSAGNVWKRNIRMVSSLLLGVLVLGGSVARAAGGTSRDSHGTDFWVAFMQNYTGAPTLSLFITSGEACSGTVIGAGDNV